ncbi:G-protein coupled receptor family C group 6 member A-like [Polypterus senegalus]|uniref:G-protein coupled receptor family C group 6 member A-like n=1 Tax=Polypterus senegalus TaxID=55291 RepID=UPI0019649CF6|nr:G-protein coupled receptor family C group 6 member A-like [Polypterus senegalus]
MSPSEAMPGTFPQTDRTWEVSYSATSVVLSDKSIYPSFLRTTPSDLHQTNAMAKLASTLHWTSIGAIGSNDEYGYYGTEEFIVQAAKYNLCISFKKIIQALMFRKDVCGDNCLFEILKVINQSAAEAVIVFTKEANVKRILEGAIHYNISQTWIATDTWSTSVLIAGLPGIERIGRILGFVQNRQAVPYFREYVRDLSKQNVSKNCFFNQYLKNYPPCGYNALSNFTLSGQCRWNDSFDTKKNNCTPSDFLESNIDEDSSFSIYLAVNAIARALGPICKNSNCSNDDFPSWQLLQELKRVNFSLNNVDVQFDKNGDFLLGYDIIGWKLTSPAQFETIGIYKTSGEIVIYNESQWTSKNITVTADMCYKVCKPGQKLTATDRTCCFECTACSAGYYSSGGYETECKQCKEDEYSLNQSASCIPREIDFLRWNDTFAAILITLNSTGMALIVLFILVFSFHFNTPVIKCAGGPLCFVMLASLLASFFSVFTFVGQPTTLSCQIQQPLFAVSFTLCIACTIAVIVQIFIAFTFDIEMNCKLQKFNKPVLITIGCTTLQAVLCVLRIKLEKLDAIRDSRTFQEKILYECKAESDVYFGLILGYIALLALICFIFAFKGRHLPDMYKNAKFITISMLISIVAWAVFVPIRLTITGKYLSATEASTILVCNYSVLVCHFCPKVYVILFNNEINIEKAISEHIRKHYENQGAPPGSM